ncbi:MAG: DUF6348 family protein [Isosphaeraceae bacterium]
MFSWLLGKNRSALPKLPATNPGSSTSLTLNFEDEGGVRSQEFRMAGMLADVLQGLGHRVEVEGDSIRLPGSGLVARPMFVHLQPIGGGNVHTVTTIEAIHPEIRPAGLFEFQHGTGEDPVSALEFGFDQWARIDLVALQESLRDEPEECTSMVMELPAREGRPALVRRALFGPVGHMRSRPPSGGPAEEHPFCPCCLLTNAIGAFRGCLESDGFYGIRLFASRDERGKPQADCRVNGRDWAPGARALRGYAKSWPDAGFEFRKQYVALRTMPGPPR